MDEHPEYHAELAKLDTALASMKTVEDWRANPFLHLSMHLSLSEQCSIDQPRGIRQAIELLAYKRNSLHQAPPRSHGMPRQDDVGKPTLRQTTRRRQLPWPAFNGAPPATELNRHKKSRSISGFFWVGERILLSETGFQARF